MVTSISKVGAVVLNWHDPVRTWSCVRNLLLSEQVGRVWVVDNDGDGTLTRHRDAVHDARVVVRPLGENRGFSGGMNAGLVPASEEFDFVLAINNDAAIDASSLAQLVRGLSEQPRGAAAGPLITLRDGRRSSSGGRLGRLWSIDDGLEVRSPDFLTWACLVLRSEALRDLGFLDDRYFMYWEDVDFGIRARERGWDLLVVDQADALHEVSASHARAGWRVSLYSSFGLVLIGRSRGWSSLAAALTRVLLRASKAVLRGHGRTVLAHLRGAGLALRQGRDAAGWTTMRRHVG